MLLENTRTEVRECDRKAGPRRRLPCMTSEKWAVFQGLVIMYTVNSATLLLTISNFHPPNYSKHYISETSILEIQVF